MAPDDIAYVENRTTIPYDELRTSANTRLIPVRSLSARAAETKDGTRRTKSNPSRLRKMLSGGLFRKPKESFPAELPGLSAVHELDSGLRVMGSTSSVDHHSKDKTGLPPSRGKPSRLQYPENLSELP